MKSSKKKSQFQDNPKNPTNDDRSKLEAEHARLLMEIGRCEVQLDIIRQNQVGFKKKLLEIHAKLEG